MSILSWNCRGVGNTETVRRLTEMRKKYFPDFLFLTETKQQDTYMLGLQKDLCYDKMFTVAPIGLSGGLAVFWKDCYKVEVLSADKRIIDLSVKFGSVIFFLTCVYGDPVRERRHTVWEKLESIGLSRNNAWILIGDFNELLDNSEKLGGSLRNESTFWDFRNMVENCKIKEVRSIGNVLSWAGWRDNIWIQCRLDRSFGNDEWFQLFPRANLEYLEMWPSDHRPILLSFSLEPEDRGFGRFYFDKRMVGKVGIEEAITRGWSGDAYGVTSSVMDRLSRCRRELSRWKKSSQFNSLTKIQRLQKELEFEIAKIWPSARKMKLLRFELAEAYKEEERYWRQRSREQWLREGDKNTSYFHNVVKGKKIRNNILMLKDERGVEHFSEGAKGHLAVEYFRDLFMSTNPSDLETLFEGFQRRVTPEMNETLLKEITDEEIRLAAFSVKGSSAPGEDGLTGVFYRNYWQIVGPQVTEEVRSFFRTSSLPAGWNHTQLCLLPKITKPETMKDMRPISLCSVQYKIVSKLLSERLKPIMDSIISDTQGAFVGGRLISDNIVVAHEMVHGLRTKKSISEQFMAIKTDMSKAYDRVEWSFLETLMERMGFARQWVCWVMACVSTVSYTVLLNGRTHGFIKPERGIRQGDPMSPFLFIIVAEALVSILNQAEAKGRLQGIKLDKQGPAVHHLLFADDSLLMCRADMMESLEVLRCLKLYGDASGQQINPSKSSIIFGDLVDLGLREDIKQVLKIEKEGGEGTYLGLPEVFKGSKKNILNYIREKLQHRLHGWFARTLSQGGKEILLKSIGMALPVYAMSVFKLPKDLCAKLTSAMRDFWWGNGGSRRKLPWVSWDTMCKDKEEGGLGFHDLGRFNQALLGKQAWRVFSRPDSLMARVLKSRYFKNGSFLEASIGSRPSFIWRSILHGREALKSGMLRTIGSGEQTNVWTSNWLLDDESRPPMYRQNSIVDLTLLVSDLRLPNSSAWDIQKVFDTFTEEDAARILKIKLSLDKQDTDVWGFTKDGVYTTRSGYKMLSVIHNSNNPSPRPLPPVEKQLWKSIWKLKTSPKIQHFLWRALSGALAVSERLQSRGIHVDSTCLACGQASETICHVLFLCPTAVEAWRLAHIEPPPTGFSTISIFLNLHYLVAGTKKKVGGRATLNLSPGYFGISGRGGML